MRFDRFKRILYNKKLTIVPSLLIAVTVPILLAVSMISLKADHANDVNTAEGESYLAAMEKQDVRLVENSLRGHHESPGVSEPVTNPGGGDEPPTEEQNVFRMLEVEGFVGSNQPSYNPYGSDRDRADKLAEQLADGELSWKELFKNTLFVGDSIMVGFSDYKIANPGNVIADVGSMLNPHLDQNMQKIIDYNPEVLFLHYGLNEMGVEDYHLEKFIENFRADLKELKGKLPDTKIVVVSLWPVKDQAIEDQARLARIPAYNEEIRRLCVELGVAYDERAELFASNPDFYHKDGIHADSRMYRMWMNDLIKEMGLY